MLVDLIAVRFMEYRLGPSGSGSSPLRVVCVQGLRTSSIFHVFRNATSPHVYFQTPPRFAS